MKFKFLQDSGFLCAEFCAGWMMQKCGLGENTLLELRVEGDACAPTMEHVRECMDAPVSSYMRMAV